MELKIVDDFLSDYHANLISKSLRGIDDIPFPWYFINDLNGVERIGNYYFNHTLIDNYKHYSPNWLHLFTPIIDKLSISISNVYRLKVNLYPRTQRRVHHESHIDYESNSGLRTCLYYLNDNDGVTIFDGKNRIKSKRNRAALFDGSIKHHSTTPTNVNYRCTINIEYTQ